MLCIPSPKSRISVCIIEPNEMEWKEGRASVSIPFDGKRALYINYADNVADRIKDNANVTRVPDTTHFIYNKSTFSLFARPPSRNMIIIQDVFVVLLYFIISVIINEYVMKKLKKFLIRTQKSHATFHLAILYFSRLSRQYNQTQLNISIICRLANFYRQPLKLRALSHEESSYRGIYHRREEAFYELLSFYWNSKL